MWAAKHATLSRRRHLQSNSVRLWHVCRNLARLYLENMHLARVHVLAADTHTHTCKHTLFAGGRLA